MSSFLDETTVEEDLLSLFEGLSFDRLFGPEISPDGSSPERKTYGDVVLSDRLRSALERINPNVPVGGIEDAGRKVLRPESPGLIENNRHFRRMLDAAKREKGGMALSQCRKSRRV